MIPISNPFIGLRERRAVDRVLKSGMLSQGPEVAAFESEFSDIMLDGRPVAAVNSGTSGQHLALVALGIGPGDEVLVPSFTFAATANSVMLSGAVPVFCDIDPDTFCIDPRQARELISHRTRAIMPVHLFGHPADMDEITKIADSNGLFVVEDAAQAHGAEAGGQRVGTFGDASMFSLYPTKNMTSGEGGIIGCKDATLQRKVRLLRNQGMDKPYENEVVGYNNRMSDIHAAIGRVQLQRLGAWNEKRRANATFLSSSLSGVRAPQEKDGYRHVYHQYTIRIGDDRDGFARALRNEFQVGCGVYYPTPVHKLQSFSKRHGPTLKNTEQASKEVLSLPVHPFLSRRQLVHIAEAVNALARAGA